MNKDIGPCQVVDLPAGRRVWMNTLGMVVGGIVWKPAVIEGCIEPREILSLTVTFDHDIVDGAPATRFVRQLVELIESGYGLCETEAGE